MHSVLAKLNLSLLFCLNGLTGHYTLRIRSSATGWEIFFTVPRLRYFSLTQLTFYSSDLGFSAHPHPQSKIPGGIGSTYRAVAICQTLF